MELLMQQSTLDASGWNQMQCDVTTWYEKSLIDLENKYKIVINGLIEQKISIQQKLAQRYINQINRVNELRLTMVENGTNAQFKMGENINVAIVNVNNLTDEQEKNVHGIEIKSEKGTDLQNCSIVETNSTGNKSDNIDHVDIPISVKLESSTTESNDNDNINMNKNNDKKVDRNETGQMTHILKLKSVAIREAMRQDIKNKKDGKHNRSENNVNDLIEGEQKRQTIVVSKQEGQNKNEKSDNCVDPPSSIIDTRSNYSDNVGNIDSISDMYRSFKTNERMKKKIDTHIEKLKKKTRDGRKYQCNDCNHKFKTRGQAENHVANNHIVEKPFQCDKCDRSFVLERMLNSHKNIHYPKHQCNICGKKFPAKCKLRRHERTHLGEKPFKCNYNGCNESFSQKYCLVNHQRIHSGEKPYLCHICHKKFGDAGTLSNHKARLHTNNESK